MIRRTLFRTAALCALLLAAPGCERVVLGDADLQADGAVSVDGVPAGPGPILESINSGQPVPVRGGGAQFTIAGQRLLDNGGGLAVDALLNGSMVNLRLLNGQITLAVTAAALARTELFGVAELSLRSRERPDLQSPSRLFRYYSADTPAFKPGPALAAAAFPLAVGDLDGDGQLDSVKATNNSSLTFTLSSGAMSKDIVTAGEAILGVALADLNGDRQLDLVAVYRSGASQSAVVFYRKEGAPPAFEMAATLALGAGGAASAAGIAVADVNDDGRSDLTFSLYTQGRPTPYNVVLFTQ